MIRELLTPEAQTDAYVWAAVLLAGLCRSAGSHNGYRAGRSADRDSNAGSDSI